MFRSNVAVRRLVFAAAALALVGVGGLAWWVARGWWQPPDPPPPPDPRLTFATPYRNVRPEVRYVGDEACASCHHAISESYHSHPMGRSFLSVSEVADRERYDEAVHNPFTRFDTQ